MSVSGSVAMAVDICRSCSAHAALLCGLRSSGGPFED